MKKPDSADLHGLLADRHVGHLYIPECKLGSSGTRVLDAWALLPTWSPITTIGYEIKNTRSDWVRDQKFLEYRPVCHLLVVVAQKGIVTKGELPDGIGLLEPAGNRLVMRVKPARMEPDWRAMGLLMTHILMWRVRVDRARGLSREGRIQHWREFVEQKREFSLIGHSVAGRMRVLLRDALDRANVAERKAVRLAEAAAILDTLGVRLDTWDLRQEIERKVAEAGGAGVVRDIDALIHALGAVRERLSGESTREKAS